VLDPVDGTYNFVRGLVPTFGVTLAFAQGGLPVAGGVIFPKLGEFFLTEQGGGATRNGRPLGVSDIDDLAAAKIEMDFGRLGPRPDTLRRAHRMLCAAGQLRCHGCCVASMCDVAAGEGEAFVHFALSPWDYAAAMLLIQEAGGLVTRPDGSPIHLFDGRKGILAANARLHPRILSLLDA
jgi:myo-inositol-1(or 4)-monophosphatase